MEPLIEIRNLSIEFMKSKKVRVPAITQVDLTLQAGETLALVGESGSGKTLTALSIMGLLPDAAVVTDGQIRFAGQDLLQMKERERNGIRGSKIGMIFQDPTSSLSPYFTIGSQMTDGMRYQLGMTRMQAIEYSREWLTKVGIANPSRILEEYPNQLSGGMRQRVMIASVLALEPSLVIADELTTALDVTTQAEILDLLKGLQAESGMSMIFVSHDLGVVAEMCKRTAVMYAGQVVEEGNTTDLFGDPGHPYTRALLQATPRLGEKKVRLYQIPGQVPSNDEWVSSCRFMDRCSHSSEVCRTMPHMEMAKTGRKIRCWHWQTLPVQTASETAALQAAEAKSSPLILSVKDLKTFFPVRKAWKQVDVVKAVNEVSFDLREGETLALVGESGSGKTTIGRSILRLVEPTGGQILFQGKDVRRLSGTDLFAFRQQVQIVFQDPESFLNPRLTIGEAIAEPMEIHHLYDRKTREKKVDELLEAVGLDSQFRSRYPHECSGGQKQRIGIARALSLNPKIIIADEPVSALDVSIQAQVLNLFHELKSRFGLSYLFISHDLSVVRHVADRVAVMYLGRIVEIGEPDQIFTHPEHPYTKALLSSVPQTEAAFAEGQTS